MPLFAVNSDSTLAFSTAHLLLHTTTTYKYSALVQHHGPRPNTACILPLSAFPGVLASESSTLEWPDQCLDASLRPLCVAGEGAHPNNGGTGTASSV